MIKVENKITKIAKEKQIREKDKSIEGSNKRDKEHNKKQDFKPIVRLLGKDLNGNKSVYFALEEIKGIGYSFSNAICAVLNLNKFEKIGYLDDSIIDKIEDVAKNPNKYNIPSWLYNRRKDLESGKDIHLVSSDLIITIDSDIKRMKKIKSYRGVRHMFGLPVRGQRTKSNFRKKKGKALGVQRKKKK